MALQFVIPQEYIMASQKAKKPATVENIAPMTASSKKAKKNGKRNR